MGGRMLLTLPRPALPELAPGRAVEHGQGEDAEGRHVAQTRRRAIRQIPRLMTAEQRRQLGHNCTAPPLVGRDALLPGKGTL